MTPASGPPGAAAIAFRIAVLIAVVLLGTWAAHEIRDAMNLHIMPSNEQQVHRAVMLAIVAYVGLLALPFVPGAEIGIALLTAFGAAIGPLVYGATVVAMLLAYTVGRCVPITALGRLLSLLRLHRAADLVARAAPLGQEARIALLLDRAPPGLLTLALRRRYLALALAVNVPGNSIIGGGGGIMLLAGMSGLFAPVPTALAVILAVSPVPLAVALFGA
ncbi:hypothetical protein [Ovoidimarina sediminis]|uniref:hypothetical protein n=1 Tax=Ovoidimarina sediminis TaxID=3079856 RepID=UPI00290FA77A|nr:hypothetical protein [Rhodophyticola sp. MJ-SS7]MDU8942867.1 hypothetical protein [Rhodophyticola sp. MJ-SS7]